LFAAWRRREPKFFCPTTLHCKVIFKTGGIEVSDFSLLQSALPVKPKSRSMGLKMIVVCGLALFMGIPALFVDSLVDERTQREAEVVREISGHVGGEQSFLGPTLAIPYTIPPATPAEFARHGTYLVFPAQASAVAKTATEERRRSLFKVPVFKAELKLDANFDLSGVPAALPSGATLDWDRAEIVVGVSDARGAQADATLTTDGKTSTLVPANVAPDISIGSDPNQHVKLTLFGAGAASIAQPDAKFNVSSSLKFSGAQRIAVLAYGKTTHVTMQGDWPSPGFDGGFLPANHQLSGN
jgi:inner membrane protein